VLHKKTWALGQKYYNRQLVKEAKAAKGQYGARLCYILAQDLPILCTRYFCIRSSYFWHESTPILFSFAPRLNLLNICS